MSATLPGIERHPHARALLLPALPPGNASHAYLFHGPVGAGKRAVARAFAAALLSDGAPDVAEVTERVARGTHPDLTWVTPSGASEMLVSDIDQAIVAAATRTPFEAHRRVFVLESAERMGESTANRLLKTLEEPAPFVHLLLLSAHPGEVLATVASRCLPVRFEGPDETAIAERLVGLGVDGVSARACARLGLGDGERAAALALGDGPALRVAAQTLAVDALRGSLAQRPWLRLLELATAAATAAGEALAPAAADELELAARADQARVRREQEERMKRTQRRARARSLDLGLSLVGLCYRDGACIGDGAPELVHAVDQMVELDAMARAHTPAALRVALELADETRAALALNVNEELALEAFAHRVAMHPSSTVSPTDED